MKKALTDAPLVQALIDLRFSEIPSLSSIPTDLIDKIHEAMIGVGFAEKIESKGQSVSIRFDQATQQATQEKTSVNRYLFRAAGERSIIELSKSSLIYKSTEYGTFEDFYKKFDEVLSSLVELVPTLNKSLLKRVGLRYIDVIVPDSGNTLEDLISDGLLAPKLNEPIDGYKHIHGLTSKVVEVDQNKMLRVALEELPVENRSIRKILPDELVEPDQNCGLVIKGQACWANTSSPTYGILDIDHTFNFEASPAFSIDSIREATSGLYNQSKDVFWSLIKQPALNIWGYKEI
jgi:uncharacterized protein (TIGR04255 family)